MSMDLVARVAGVSKATVSRVVSGRPGVSPETAEVVRRAIALVGYHIGPEGPRRGRVPAGQRRASFALEKGFLCFLAHRKSEVLDKPSFYAPVLTGITRTLSELGHSLVVEEIEDARSLPLAVEEKRVDGLLVLAAELPGRYVEMLHRSIPCVVLGGGTEVPVETDHVKMDNVRVGEIAGRYLLERGCRQLAFLNWDPGHPDFVERQWAFDFFAHTAGVPVTAFVPPRRPVSVRDEEVMRRTLHTLTDSLIAAQPRPDGVFVVADWQVLFVQDFLAAKGVKPDKDIVLVSCDNRETLLSTLAPRPASVDIGLAEMGRRAALRLLERIAHPDAPTDRILVAPHLVRGNETTPRQQA